MKLNTKIINIIVGIIYLWQSVNCILTIPFLPSFHYNPVYLVMNFYGIIVMLIMGVYALCQKKSGKLLNYLGVFYVFYLIFVFIPSHFVFLLYTLVNLAFLIAAFILSQKASDGIYIRIKDTRSETAKIQDQVKKQKSIYDEQLRDGILTQEEYDQIMQSDK